MHEADPSRRQGHRPTTDSYYEDVTSAAPDHVGRVDVLDVAQLVLLLVRVLDSRLHELADRRQALVPDATQTQHHWLNVKRSSRSDQKLQPKPRITTNIIIHESNRNKQHRPNRNSVRELNHRWAGRPKAYRATLRTRLLVSVAMYTMHCQIRCT